MNTKIYMIYYISFYTYYSWPSNDILLPISTFINVCNGKRDIYNQIVLYSIPVTNHYLYTKGPQLAQKALFC